jgi:hypothetical protein
MRSPAMRTMGKRAQLRWFVTFVFLIFASFTIPTHAKQKTDTAAAAAADDSSKGDPILKAMREELERSKAKLKMDNVAAPYYIEYRLSDVDEYDAEAAFGGLRQDQRVHARSVRVVVRVGTYKQDSYYGPEGEV